MKNLILSWLGLAAIASASAETAPVWEMESPDGNIKVAIGQNNATPVFNVSYQGKEVCAAIWVFSHPMPISAGIYN